MSSDLWKIGGRLAGAIDQRLGPGERAALRRLEPSDAPPPAFWRLLADSLDEDAQPRTVEHERAYQALASALAHLEGLRGEARLGQALGRAGYSEMRVERLLRAQGDDRPRELLVAARFLAAKGAACRPSDFSALALLPAEGEATERALRAIARDYFSSIHSEDT